VFSSVLWGKQYDNRRAPALGEWMHDVVMWLSNTNLPVKLSAPRVLQLGTTQVKDGWLLYFINQSNDIQGKRQEWTEMMKVAERPWSIGMVTAAIPGMQQVKAIYGPEPDLTNVNNGELEIVYKNFCDHVVLHVM
jgi:hypothetical protein